jgi:hypothetical protein
LAAQFRGLIGDDQVRSGDAARGVTELKERLDWRPFSAADQEERFVVTAPIPVKTADGLAELSQRQRRLSQRHRTVLLLVDGRRTEQQVRSMAQQAGSGESCFGDLLDLGLIALQQPKEPADPLTSTVPLPRTPEVEDTPLHVDIPIDDPLPAPAAPGAPPPKSHAPAAEDHESVLPAARTLQPESVLNDSLPGASTIEDFDAIEAQIAQDSSLEEARGILLRAVRSEAPLTGSLTMLRLRRARTRDDLMGLIDEVEDRIVKPYRSLAAQQVLRRARHLLVVKADAQPAG